MDSKIGFEMRLIVVDANTWATCEFHGSNDNGFGDILWTDELLIYQMAAPAPCPLQVYLDDVWGTSADWLNFF